MIKKNGRPLFWGIIIVCMFSALINHYVEKEYRNCFPNMAYLTEENPWEGYLRNKIGDILPVYIFCESGRIVVHRQDSFLIKNIKPVELLTMMEVENLQEEKQQMPDDVQNIPVENQPVVQEEVLKEQIETHIVETAKFHDTFTSFEPHSLQTIVNMQELEDFNTLLGRFYIIDSVAKVDGDMLNAQELNAKDLRIQKTQEGPQILIYHTHSQEAFADSVPGDESTTIVGAGEHLAEILREQYGYDVLHHKGQYDVQTRDNAYSRALPEIEKILEENPTIQVVIDLHRDGIDENNGKLMMDLDGRPTAKFMFFNGVSCGKRTGNIDYLYNPNLEDNLAFSFQLKKAAEEYYPGLARKNYINAYRYNMHLCGRTTLLELGAQNNTVEEIWNACYPIAHILDMVLSGA